MPDVPATIEKRKRGRPSLCTPAHQTIILDSVRKGNYFETAARAAGISTAALAQWRRRGLAGEQPYSGFLEQLEVAMSECERNLVAIVHDAAPQDWRAADSLLQRRWPERWARNRWDEQRPLGTGLNIHLHLGQEHDEAIETTGQTLNAPSLRSR